MTQDPPKTSGHPWPRSFLRRQGQATRAQKQALRELWPHYGLRYHYGQTLDLQHIFNRNAHTVLDIGFGMGESLIARAAQHPEWNFLGIEVHKPGLGAALQNIHQHNLSNVRVLRGDVLEVLTHHIAPQDLHEASLFFPDPWPRDKDAARRLLNDPLLNLLAKILPPQAILHLATDVPVYAQHSLHIIENHPQWINQAGPSQLSTRPTWRPITRYEARALNEGRTIHDMRFLHTPTTGPEDSSLP